MSTFDLPLFARRARQVTTTIRPAMREAQARIAQEAIQASRGFLDRDIYSKPEDTRPKSGAKKWQRSGQLRSRENVVIREDDSVALTNATAYAEPRHEANKPGRRQINPARTAHWRDETLEVMQPRQREIYREAIAAVLRAGGR